MPFRRFSPRGFLARFGPFTASALGCVGCTIVLPCERTLTCAGDDTHTGNGGAGPTDGSLGAAEDDSGVGGGFGNVNGSVTIPDASGAAAAECDEACVLPERCCDGECVDTESSLEHCGGCGNRCEHAGAVSQCVAGECEFVECDDTHLDCNEDVDDGCEAPLGDGPAVPELELPLNGAYTGSFEARNTGTQKPRFVWTEVPPSACAVTYEIQLDDSCTLDAPAECGFLSPLNQKLPITTDTPTFTPTSDLPVETTAPVGTRYTWRVRACDDVRGCSEDWSEPRTVNVGRAVNDLDGDGFADVVAVESGSLVVYRGKGNFGEATPVTPVEVPGVELGDSPTVRWLGDVNADGFADLGIGSHLDGSLTNPPTLLFGGEDVEELGMADGSSVLLDPGLAAEDVDPDYDVEFAPLGDHDGDGLADFAVFASPAVSTLYLGARNLDEMAVPAASFEHSAEGDARGGLVGDMTGDGLDDAVIAVGDRDLVALVGRLDDDEFEALVLEPDAACPGVNDGPAQEILGGDFDDDGFADFVRLCTATGGESLTLRRGGTSPGSESATFAVASATHGVALDLDRDGITDLLVQQDDQSIAWYVGGSSFLTDLLSDAGASGSQRIGSFTPSIAARAWVSGDYDSDGFPDLCFDDVDGNLYCAAGNGSLTLPPFGTFATLVVETLGW